MVLAHDPAVRAIAADYWMHSERFYARVAARLTELCADAPETSTALRGLTVSPTDVAAQRRFEAALDRGLVDRLGQDAELVSAVRAADEHVYIDYFLGSQYAGAPEPIGLDDLVLEGKRTTRHSTAADGAILVVIPVMERAGTGRIRNLVACLLALRDQSLEPSRYRITVVEYDAHPRWGRLIEPLADHYLHAKGGGRFNKSWALNLGVCRTPGRPRLLCLLDADILVDRFFLERNAARFSDPYHDAHLPHTECLSLDAGASDSLIESRCYTGTAAPPLPDARGLLLRHAPGGCLWIRPESFHRIGGLDERYAGWGGEDEDMLIRTAASGSVVQFDDPMVHLFHPRPPMRRSDGAPINGHIVAGTWTGAAGYGEMSGPRPAGGPE
jgi:hypothetical protein